jgi:hypothetical protein
MVFLMLQVVSANFSTIALVIGIVILFSAFFIAKTREFVNEFIIGPVMDGIKEVFPSDERIKENILYLGKTDLDPNINVYQYNYIHDPRKKTYVGIMAQDLQDSSYEDCLSTDESGLMRINYRKLKLTYDNTPLPFVQE